MMETYSFLWDYDLSKEEYLDILAGKLEKGRLNRDWAAVRLLEYATYKEIIQLLGYSEIVAGWPTWREKIRSESRRRGFDFLVSWLPENHPELMSSE